MNIRKHTPLILSVLGCIGVVGTAVTAHKAALDTRFIFENEEFTRWEKLKKAIPYYVPSVLVGGSTITCILSAHALNMKTQATLISAYSFLNESYENYRQAVIDEFGEDADNHISIVVNDGIVCDFEKLQDCTDVFVDDFLKVPFETTKEQLLLAELELNRTFILKGYVSLYDFYSYIGLLEEESVYHDKVEEIMLSQKFGWSMDVAEDWGYAWIDITKKAVEDSNGRKYYILKYDFQPVIGYLWGGWPHTGDVVF